MPTQKHYHIIGVCVEAYSFYSLVYSINIKQWWENDATWSLYQSNARSYTPKFCQQLIESQKESGTCRRCLTTVHSLPKMTLMSLVIVGFFSRVNEVHYPRCRGFKKMRRRNQPSEPLLGYRQIGPGNTERSMCITNVAYND